MNYMHKVIFHAPIKISEENWAKKYAFMRLEAELPFAPTVEIFYDVFGEKWDGRQAESVHWIHKSKGFTIWFPEDKQVFLGPKETTVEGVIKDYVDAGWERYNI